VYVNLKLTGDLVYMRRFKCYKVIVQVLCLVQPLPGLVKCTDTIPDPQAITTVFSHPSVGLQVGKVIIYSTIEMRNSLFTQ